jgi:hypothetical protein
VPVTAGSTFFSFWVQGVEGATGTAVVTASAPGFTDGTGSVDVRPAAFEISGLSTSLNTASPLNAFAVRVGYRNQPTDTYLWTTQGVRAGADSLTVTVASSSPAVAQIARGAERGSSLQLKIGPGSSSTATGTINGFSLETLTAGSTNVTASIPGLAAALGSVAVNVAQQSISVNSVTVGAGLQTATSLSLSGSRHGGTTIRITSGDPTRVLLATNPSNAGSEFLDITVPDGSTGFTFTVQGLEGATGTVNLTASAPGFLNGSSVITIVQAAAEIINLAGTMTAGGADDPFNVRTGIPNADFQNIQTVQAVRAGSTVTATITVSPGANATLVTSGGTADTATVTVAAGASQSPNLVSAGGVAFRPLLGGSATVTVAVPGFRTIGTGTRTVTINP